VSIVYARMALAVVQPRTMVVCLCSLGCAVGSLAFVDLVRNLLGGGREKVHTEKEFDCFKAALHNPVDKNLPRRCLGSPQLIKIFFSRFSLVLKASKKHRIVEKCFKTPS
jgi:hypothetical protein